MDIPIFLGEILTLVKEKGYQMITFYTGNIFDSKTKIIAHQVNCMGKMGSGLALQVKQKYPNVFYEYHRHYDDQTKKLGDCLCVLCPDGRVIANLYGQYGYGYDGVQYTSHESLKKAMISLASLMSPGHSIAFPYKMSCDRGGGSWNVVSGYISTIFENYEVEIWRLPLEVKKGE
jgi:O-acetyl-ADP-ribose deacetylase (regulator of RNase III)